MSCCGAAREKRIAAHRGLRAVRGLLLSSIFARNMGDLRINGHVMVALDIKKQIISCMATKSASDISPVA